MDEIRLALFKLMQYALYGSLLPIIGMLIIAAFNDRIRRLMVWVMGGITVVVVFAAFLLAPRNLSTAGDLSLAINDVTTSIVNALPFVVALVVLGLMLFLYGPSLLSRVDQYLYSTTRRQYLLRLQEGRKNHSQPYAALKSRDALFQPITTHLQISGPPGSGKSALLQELASWLAGRALENEDEPVPVLIDLDDILARFGSIEAIPLRLSILQAIRVPMLERMLAKSVRNQRLCFLIDSSVQTYAGETYTLLRDLSKMVDFFAPCFFVLAIPDSIPTQGIEGLFHPAISLQSLSDDEVAELAGAWLHQPGEAQIYLAALQSHSSWKALSRRTLLLRHLTDYWERNKRLPDDLRDLFRTTLYPAAQPYAPLEAFLTCLSDAIARKGKYWLPVVEAAKASESIQPAEGRRLIQSLEQAGLLQFLARDDTYKDEGRPVLVSFAHPLYLAYFTALSWLTSESIPADPEALRHDPLLGETFILFNNLIADRDLFSSAIARLVEHEDRSTRLLVLQSLLSMPVENRPVDVIQQLGSWLMQEFASQSESAGEQAENRAASEELTQAGWALISKLPENARLQIYQRAIDQMSPEQVENALIAVANLARSEPEESDELRMILWNGEAGLAQAAAKAWSTTAPDETFQQVGELYEQGPIEKREPAVEILGILPHEACALYLRHLLAQEPEPGVRKEIIRSLVNQQATGLFGILLQLAANNNEVEEVRVTAAQLLAFSDSQEVISGGGVRELVRTTRMPLPERVREQLFDLLESLRRMAPDQVARWESLANPYISGRPVETAEMFFGHEQLLHDLLTALEQGQSAIICGERRIGKSSILRFLRLALEESAQEGAPYRCALLSVEDRKPHEFFMHVSLGLLNSLGTPHQPLALKTAIPYREFEFADDLAIFKRHLQSQLGDGARLVLLVDDADGIFSFNHDTQAALRHILEANSPNLTVVLAAQQPPPAESLLAGLLVMNTIARLTRDQARALIVEPVIGSIDYEPESVDAILEACQGRPGNIQDICFRLLNTALVCGTRTITHEMAQKAIDAAYGQSGPREALLAQSERLLGGLMDWLSEYPEAGNVEIEEQLKKTFQGVREVIVKEVIRARKRRDSQ